MTTRHPLKIGSVIKSNFPSHVPPGHEQTGSRPAIIVALPATLDTQRFNTVIVVPTTTNDGTWSNSNKLYPTLPRGAGGLPNESVVLIDQIRALDCHRLLSPTSRYLGDLDKLQTGLILSRIKEMFRFS